MSDAIDLTAGTAAALNSDVAAAAPVTDAVHTVQAGTSA